MAKLQPKVLAQHAVDYLKQHPQELFRVIRGVLGLRFGVPIEALRFLAREFGGGKKAPKDVVIGSVPPGLQVAATIDAMGSMVRASLVVEIVEVLLDPSEMRIVVRISNMNLEVLDDSETPVAGLIKSGALDLSKPGNLVAFMPKRPAILVDAKDDLITLDLMKNPKIAGNPKVKRLLSILTPVLGIRAIATENEHLDVYLKAALSGIPDAVAAARS